MSARTSFNELLGGRTGALVTLRASGTPQWLHTSTLKNGIHIIDLNKTIVKIDDAVVPLSKFPFRGAKFSLPQSRQKILLKR